MTNLVKFLMVLRSLVEHKNQRMHKVEFRGSNPQMSYLGLNILEPNIFMGCLIIDSHIQYVLDREKQEKISIKLEYH